MIIVDKEHVEISGHVTDLCADIVQLFKAIESSEPDEYNVFRQTALFSIFSICYTPDELEKALNNYKQFNKLRKEVFNEK